MGDEIRISELLETIGDIGQSLLRLSNTARRDSDADSDPMAGSRSESDINEISTQKLRDFAHKARNEYQSRLRRNSIVGRNLFGEPAWDILLDLFVARVEGIRLSVKAVCIGSQVPYGTAFRWIAVLESEGFLVRFPDPADGRRVWVELSDFGLHRMYQYFRDQTSHSTVQVDIQHVSPAEGGALE
jgi:hypothetical protein